MNKKWPLYAGILLLTAGIVLRKTTDIGMTALALIFSGVLLKTYYIISKVRNGEYSAGYELIFLIVGLGMFLTGLYFKNNGGGFNPLLLIMPGIALKIAFIVIFIIKVKRGQQAMTE